MYEPLSVTCAPPGFVTTTSTAPAEWAPVEPDTCVPAPFTVTDVNATPPMVTVVPETNPVPVIVTVVPPEVVPEDGTMLLAASVGVEPPGEAELPDVPVPPDDAPVVVEPESDVLPEEDAVVPAAPVPVAVGAAGLPPPAQPQNMVAARPTPTTAKDFTRIPRLQITGGFTRWRGATSRPVKSSARR